MDRNIDCLICSKPVLKHYVTFFFDLENKRRYGAICPKCYNALEKTHLPSGAYSYRMVAPKLTLKEDLIKVVELEKQLNNFKKQLNEKYKGTKLNFCEQWHKAFFLDFRKNRTYFFSEIELSKTEVDYVSNEDSNYFADIDFIINSLE